MAPSAMLLLASTLAASAMAAMPASARPPRVISMPISRSLPRGMGLEKRGTISATLNNTIQYAGYLTNIEVGTPAQSLSLLLDTGSSDIWMFGPHSCDSSSSPCAGGSFVYQQSTSFSPLNKQFSIKYETPGSGVEGEYFRDDINVGGTTITSQIMAVASSAKNTNTGIIGVGFTSDESSVSNGQGTYPNIIDSMVTQGKISAKAYSLYLDDLEASTGTILFGGYDSDKYEGNMVSLPIEPDEQSGGFTSMTVAWTSLIISDGSGAASSLTGSGFSSPAVLDSGTTLTLVPANIYSQLASYFNVEAGSNGLDLVSCDLRQAKGTLDFGFGGDGGVTIAVPFSELAIPLLHENGSPYTFGNGDPACHFGLAYPQTGQQILFGDTFLRSAYVIYDLDTKHIGLAQTKFNSGSSNIHEIGSDGNFGAVATAPSINVTPTAYKPIAPAPATQTPVNRLTEPAPYQTRTLPGDPTSAPTGAAGVSNPAGAASTSKGAANRLHAGPIPDGLGESMAVSAVAAAFVMVGAVFGFM